MFKKLLVSVLLLSAVSACDTDDYNDVRETPNMERAASLRVDGYLLDLTFVSGPTGGYFTDTDDNGETFEVHWLGRQQTTTVTAREPFLLEEDDDELVLKAMAQFCDDIGLTFSFEYGNSHFDGKSWINEGGCQL